MFSRQPSVSLTDWVGVVSGAWVHNVIAQPERIETKTFRHLCEIA
jgi:hypothetical protein